jgi:tRNA threonylcarbamoyladenosine biosynthesis protein TsaE
MLTFMKIKLEELEKFANEFLETITENSNRAVVIGLLGDLGSGKTTFVQKVSKALDIEKQITSPTFVIMKRYEIPDQVRDDGGRLVHIDAYRFKSGKELEVLGFEELLKDSKNLIFIEWPENVADVLPDDTIKIKFEVVDENTREISI